MKAIFLALFVVAVTATPLPEDVSGSDAVEITVNGVPDGAALEVSDIVDIKLKEHSNGALVATNLLHPYTAVGIAEAAAAVPVPNYVSVIDSNMAAIPVPDAPEMVIPKPIVMPPPAVPVPIVMPPPAVSKPFVMPLPAVPKPIVMPPPAVPKPIVMLPHVVPEVVMEPEQLPVAAPQYNGEVYNDGIVQVQYNGPEEPGMFSTIQNWFNMVVNYFNSPSSGHAAPEPRH